MKWEEVSARLGRNDLPEALARAALIDRVMTDPAEISAALEDAWTMPEWPLSQLQAEIWLTLFSAVLNEGDYLHGGTVRPTSDLPEVTTLWRGAIPEHKYGMSWTDDRDQAWWFATRFGKSRPARLYTIEATPVMVLARFESRRGEHEWVLDPDLVSELTSSPA